MPPFKNLHQTLQQFSFALQPRRISVDYIVLFFISTFENGALSYHISNVDNHWIKSPYMDWAVENFVILTHINVSWVMEFLTCGYKIENWLDFIKKNEWFSKKCFVDWHSMGSTKNGHHFRSQIKYLQIYS